MTTDRMLDRLSEAWDLPWTRNPDTDSYEAPVKGALLVGVVEPMDPRMPDDPMFQGSVWRLRWLGPHCTTVWITTPGEWERTLQAARVALGGES